MSLECHITGRVNGHPATFRDYERLFEPCERPSKFSGEEVGFMVPDSEAVILRCHMCRHWFFNVASDRKVCEIMRLRDEVNVNMYGTCRFWNRDGKHFPLLKVL